MSKFKNILLFGVLPAALLTGSILVFRRVKNNKTKKVNSEGKVTDCVIFPLKLNSGYASNPCSKDEVFKFQSALNKKISDFNKSQSDWRNYIKMLTVDGKFGPMTEEALNKLYNVKKVSADLYKKLVG